MIEETSSFWKISDNLKYVQWLKSISTAENADEADTLRNKFEYSIVHNEAVTEVAEHFIPLVLNSLPKASHLGRAKLFDLLYSLGAGYSYFDNDVNYADVNLEIRCRRQVAYGVSQYFYYLENGSREEKQYLPDLLELCSRGDDLLKEKVLWWLEVLIEEESSDQLKGVYQRNISELKS